MSKEVLESALSYHNEGLCCIPVVYRDKKPALVTWEEYHTRQSTLEEIQGWFGNGHQYNIGIVHGSISGNYITIDIDHDSGIFSDMMGLFPRLFWGRIEQSGSGEGFHIPLRVDRLPDFGDDSKQGRPRGNRTWKTEKGHVNLRCRWCQTVAPPSIHPCGREYQYIQKGDLVTVPNIDNLIDWLGELAPPPRAVKDPDQRERPPVEGGSLLEVVKATWPDVITVFQEFGLVREIKEERNNRTGSIEFRLLGNGGLLVTQDKQKFYNFSDEFGGGIFEAWGYCRIGSSYDNRKHFRQVLLDMARAAGIDLQQFYKSKDEQRTMATSGNTRYWGKQHAGYWERAR